MSTYNEELQQNNAELEELLEMAQSLPDADVGGDYIPVPATAEVGQTIRVSAVDENGKPTAWEAVDMDEPDEFVTLCNLTLETAVANTDSWGGESHQYNQHHYWTTDVELDGIYIKVHVPAQSEDIVSSGELQAFVGQSTPTGWNSWVSNERQPYGGYGSFVSTTGKEVWAEWNYDLRNRTMNATNKSGHDYAGNFVLPSYASVNAISFPKAVANNGWTYWRGAKLYLVSGSLPAGTEILIYGRKKNANKFLALPDWSDAT